MYSRQSIRWLSRAAPWLFCASAVLAQSKSHWAYQPPARPKPPTVERPDWGHNPIDNFVLHRLESERTQPSSRADRARLLRRVTLDLTGLPPTIEEVDAFVQDDSSRAWFKVVDRLLTSPRFGEHWAQQWLDLARYADSNGFQADQLRDSWAYRDWVIDALNADMPFDQFTIEQLAGDLLPNATLDQRIATGFHRNVTCNVEAGVAPEQNRVHQVVDRVNTTATVWLGSTLECAQCHDHKYDPFSQRDYYRLFAFFNNTPIEVKNGAGVRFDFYGPKLTLPLPEADREQRKQLEIELADLRAKANPDVPKDIARLLQLKRRLGPREQKRVDRHFAGRDPDELVHARRLCRAQARLAAIRPPTALVMVEDKQRTTHLMRRGDYLRPGERVTAGTPAALHPFRDEWPKNRLGLARWLSSPDNPLVARVTVNRWWSQIFGRGLVPTEEDFGMRSPAPSHPELLDWLAVEFMESGWSMKHVLRLIVTSATYQQSSRRNDDSDPDNLLLGRGPRFRMSAQMIRDNALQIAGLLSLETGGRPVYPPQPPRLWRQVGRNEPKYVIATDQNRFRRGVYVVWRRAAPYPSFVLFDSPDRSTCHPRRSRTNTPMQALTLMNDAAYVEAAMGLALRVVRHRDRSLATRARYAFRLAVARHPTPAELGRLQSLWTRETRRLRANPEQAAAVLDGVYDIGIAPGTNPIEAAAWFFVATVLLNLDETISKG